MFAVFSSVPLIQRIRKPVFKQKVCDCPLTGGQDGFMITCKNRHHFVAADPHGVFNLDWIDGDFLARCLSATPKHQGRRKGPGLTGQIVHMAHAHARFLKHLTAHGSLQRLARFDKASQKGVHPVRPPRRASHQHRIAMSDQHDDNRISARKVVRVTGGTGALPTAMRHVRRSPAFGTKTVALMPAKDRLGRGRQFRIAGRQPGHHPAQFCKDFDGFKRRMMLFRRIDKGTDQGRVQIVRLPRRQVMGKAWCALLAPQKDRGNACILERRVVHRHLHHMGGPRAGNQDLAPP
mmetsp:Transcript_27558/g.51066  ORF Transcript_27558/g.51066 Transcript_27558/m.51066 type:complete len:292 (+) Transcript_27558:1656-2531(+)